jgi:hypothetical protein
MVQRETYRDIDSDISVVTEQMADGRWAVAVSVVHSTQGADQATPLPMTHERFATEAEARAHGLRAGREWIERNAPSGTLP